MLEEEHDDNYEPEREGENFARSQFRCVPSMLSLLLARIHTANKPVPSSKDACTDSLRACGTDIEDHADELGIDLNKYPMLEYLVVECLKAKLPPGWKPVKDETSDEMCPPSPFFPPRLLSQAHNLGVSNFLALPGIISTLRRTNRAGPTRVTTSTARRPRLRWPESTQQEAIKVMMPQGQRLSPKTGQRQPLRRPGRQGGQRRLLEHSTLTLRRKSRTTFPRTTLEGTLTWTKGT